MVRVQSPPQIWSQAVVCVSTPRMYPQSGYFLVLYKISNPWNSTFDLFYNTIFLSDLFGKLLLTKININHNVILLILSEQRIISKFRCDFGVLIIWALNIPILIHGLKSVQFKKFLSKNVSNYFKIGFFTH